MTDLPEGGPSGERAIPDAADPQAAELAALRARNAELVAENSARAARIAQLEACVEVLEAGLAAGRGPSLGTGTAAAALSAGQVSTAPPPLPPTHPPAPPTSGRSTATAVGEAQSAFDTERFIGRRVVPIVGAVAVIGAVGFLVHFAIDTGLWGRMPAEFRFMLGLLIGAALLVGGEFVRRRAPGAAVGLDAAGIGAFLVTIAIGVYGLELFGAQTGALLSGAAGIFGAAWSVRTRSAVVGVCALAGLLGAPVTFGLLREGVVLSGSLLTVGILSGIAMQVLADETARKRFEVPRFVALGAALIGGAYLLDIFGAAPSVVAIGFMLLWFGAFVAGSALLALRGYGSATGAIVLAIASVGAFLVQIRIWGMTTPGDFRAWFPALAGGLLAATALFLRSFAPPKPAPDEVADSREEIDRTGIECARLSEAALALGLTLFVGGFVHFAPQGGQSFAMALIALGLVVAAVRLRGISFDLLSAVVAFFTGIFTWWCAFEAMSVTSVRVTLPLGAEIGLRLSWEMAGVVAGASVLFASAIFRARTPTDAIRAAFAAFAWMAPSFHFCTDIVIAGLFALPAIIVGFVPKARRTLVIATLALLPFGYLSWSLMLANWLDISRSGWARLEIGGCSLAILALASVIATRHRALGRARAFLAPIGLGLTALAIAGYVVGCGEVAGLATANLALVFVAASGILAAVLVLALPRLVRTSMGDAASAGLVLSIVSTWVAAIMGMVQLLSRDGDGAPDAWLALLAIAAVAAATWAGRISLRENPGLARFTTGATTLSAVTIVSLGAILLAAVIPGGTQSGLGALAVTAWILVVGVGEIVLGFARRWPALRWGGLIAFVLLVVRLFFVDLAGAPTLIRVALLFATGLVLVGVGIIYARLGRGGSGEVESGSIAS